MHRLTLTVTLAVAMVLVGFARDASAQVGQPWTDRGYLNLNVAFETTSGDLNGVRTFRRFGEDGSLETGQAFDSGALFDFSVGGRVWRNATVGLGFHRESTTGDGTLQARVPNPVLFNRLRTVTLAIGDLKRTERAFHLQFGYMIPVNEQLQVHVFLGPSFFRVTQDVIADASFAEVAFPFDTVNATAVVEGRRDSATGFHAGLDAAYELFRTDLYKLGAGVFLRYAGATADIRTLDNTVGSDAGGLQFGLGARLRF